MRGAEDNTSHRLNHKAGKLDVTRTPGGHRRICIEGEAPKDKPIVCYARVSTHSQRDDLERQAEFLRQKYPEAELVTEVGSGLNFKRRKLLKILERVCAGDIRSLIIAYSDRLVRFGFPLVEWLCEQNGVKLVVLNQRSLSPQEELVEDILAILHCFSARLYGLRKYEKQARKAIQDKASPSDDQVDTQQCQKDQGVSI
ncbi:MAG: IS607 family transposase [Symploca sp. SIO2E9]|nr:IS607 family transposase [Symploca sp. SIO2E9]